MGNLWLWQQARPFWKLSCNMDIATQKDRLIMRKALKLTALKGCLKSVIEASAA
jgi:hypothetical protein